MTNFAEIGSIEQEKSKSFWKGSKSVKNTRENFFKNSLTKFWSVKN